jgi:hypothetical protein
MSVRAVALGCACAALVACTRTGDEPATSRHARLPPGVVARVANEEIALETVQRVARAEGVTLEIARDRAVSDARSAAETRAIFRGREVLPVLERAASARALLESLKQDALAKGPATDAEVAEQTALRWREFDRPEAARTTHAVALVDKNNDEAKARAVAQDIYEAVRSAKNSDEFLRLAEAVPHDGVEVRAERLPAVTADGRVYDPDKPSATSEQMLDLDFAKAAIALTAGQISAPTKTRFGYHVIFCEARLPELRVPLEDRRRLMHDEVIKARAERSKQELLARLSAAAPIPISRAVDDLTSLIRIEE